MPSLHELRYVADSSQRFQHLLERPWCVFLDSISGAAGRYDILAADPHTTLVTRGAITEIRSPAGVELDSGDPLRLLHERLGPALRHDFDLPFVGGALGFFSYDLGRRFEHLPSIAAADMAVPDMAVGLYDTAIVVDHGARRAWLVGAGREQDTFDEWARRLECIDAPAPPPGELFEVLSAIRSNFSRARYADAFASIQTHIRRGDCYQVNLAQRFTASVRGHPWHAYLSLRRLNPAPYSAYLGFPDCTVLSSSPELFLRVSKGHVEAKPIKGTRRRGADSSEDRASAAMLAGSAKDRAENVMIVDLLRNDLGKCCAPGSVHVSNLFEIESFARVHHLVSTVEGELTPGRHALELLRGAFPGGSITGAPKLRAMQIIEALEPQRRGLYCGSIGYVGYDGGLALNIAIRSLVHLGGNIHTWAGGGIVADSDAESEYQECLDKAEALLAVLEESTRRAG